jgi:hypothetical protein
VGFGQCLNDVNPSLSLNVSIIMSNYPRDNYFNKLATTQFCHHPDLPGGTVQQSPRYEALGQVTFHQVHEGVEGQPVDPPHTAGVGVAIVSVSMVKLEKGKKKNILIESPFSELEKV